jgi:superfamily I DNA/RNA helicase
MPKEAPMPHPLGKSPWEREQEYNLLYVAITRAIEELVFVT